MHCGALAQRKKNSSANNVLDECCVCSKKLFLPNDKKDFSENKIFNKESKNGHHNKTQFNHVSE